MTFNIFDFIYRAQNPAVKSIFFKDKKCRISGNIYGLTLKLTLFIVQ